MHNALPAIVTALDWVGTLAFALSGAILGVKKEFDLSADPVTSVPIFKPRFVGANDLRAYFWPCL